jgi:apolipoprotein N-acyltransferase
VALIGSRVRQRPTWPSIALRPEPPFSSILGAALAAGTAVALSLPPFGWWPLAIVGLAGLAACLHRRPWWQRAALGAAAGFGQFAIGLWWVTEFSVPGYAVLVLLSMLFVAAACAAVASWRPVGILLGLPATLTLLEWVRGHVPFGGLPLGGIPLGQAAGPLAAVARVGGPVLLTGATAATAAAMAVMARSVVSRGHESEASGDGVGDTRGRRAGPLSAAAAAVVLVAVVALVVAGRLGPDGSGGGPPRSIRVAAVQGGGPRGLRANQADPNSVFQRQVVATAALRPPLDLVVWPEDVVSVDRPVAETPEAATVAQLAQRLAATVVAGVVEDVGSDRFRNAAVAWSPAGVIVARYDKVHRVPFGEYIPGRSLFRRLANLDLVPRDAIAGHGPGLLDIGVAPLGAVISYEVFFPDRARAAINAGGQLLLIPTNASSYRTSQVPTQEVAAAQLRAWETGRDAIQAAPTGYSALIDHDGRVLVRSTLGREQAITGMLTLRTGRTWYGRFGDFPTLAMAIVALAATVGGIRARFRQSRKPR